MCFILRLRFNLLILFGQISNAQYCTYIKCSILDTSGNANSSAIVILNNLNQPHPLTSHRQTPLKYQQSDLG